MKILKLSLDDEGSEIVSGERVRGEESVEIVEVSIIFPIFHRIYISH